ncbi:sulfite oxidase heme-binding subunit YedZ [Pseudomarimonas arenosa]|uniref:Protein-methionine-sulfoxide reductase heme-binding subunit MsrQ n=1 Tax=Pseudomarimonas arenosa TaxID=2774145 RepID=A0AAW3ZJE7_9GAMM|nr:protein-methionine-sulfoxide reductase heme-binding subunit MsrQ [Pseudomarimonas arenosa]MBD8524576.1 sulfoxide reductase heme-binding subunit YedZ [Pseudomarimonas arenosa]
MPTSESLQGRWPSASLRAGAHLACLVPFLLWTWRAWHAQLGADPIAELTHASGDWALRFLLGCLAMTPLRRASGWRWPIQYRRMLGLYGFFYASVHLAIYLVLDLGGYWAQILDDILKRPFITVGFLAWLLLIPLALTSTRAAMRWLGRRWGQLHKLVYLIAALGILHFLWLVKADLSEPLIYLAVFVLLMLMRIRGGQLRFKRPG